MTVKKLENAVTRFGVLLLLILTFAGIIFVFDVTFDLDLVSDGAKTAIGILLAIMCVLVASSVLVSIMLNVSRIANSIELIAGLKKEANAKDVQTEIDNKNASYDQVD